MSPFDYLKRWMRYGIDLKVFFLDLTLLQEQEIIGFSEWKKVGKNSYHTKEYTEIIGEASK